MTAPTRALLLALLLVVSMGGRSLATEGEWPVIETGRANFYWSFSLRSNPDPVPPGGVIASEARWAEPPLTGSVIWYFAGLSGQTLHIFVIFQEFNKAAGRVLEIERRPIYLTLDKDDSALLTLLPLHAKPAVLKLKRNADESLAVALVPREGAR
jgi:hypothetical protein